MISQGRCRGVLSPFTHRFKFRLKPNFQTNSEFSLIRLPPNKRMQIYTPNVRTMSNSSPTTATRENCKWLIFVIFCLLRPWRPRSDCRCMQVCVGPWLHHSCCWHRLVVVSSDAHQRHTCSHDRFEQDTDKTGVVQRYWGMRWHRSRGGKTRCWFCWGTRQETWPGA